VQFENDGDFDAHGGPIFGELLGAFSSLVFDRGKSCRSGSDGPDNGQATSVGAGKAPRGDTAMKHWGAFGQRCDAGPVGSQVAVGEQVPWGWDDDQGHQ
jgi:hypothetical protein